eukprot:607057-Prymnesium_polylepis.1
MERFATGGIYDRVRQTTPLNHSRRRHRLPSHQKSVVPAHHNVCASSSEKLCARLPQTYLAELQSCFATLDPSYLHVHER